MVTDDPIAASRIRHWFKPAIASLALVAGAVVGWALSNNALTQLCAQTQEKAPVVESPLESSFKGWARPDVALVLSGQDHGYLQPCGCSDHQLGGVARRYNFFQILKQKGWPAVAVDVGDIAQRSGPQRMLKYVTFMNALRLMGYSAVGIGQYETSLPLWNALGEYSLNNPEPKVVSANLKDKKEFGDDTVWNTTLVGGQKGIPRIGIIGLMGESVIQAVQQQTAKFVPSNEALPLALAELAPKQPQVLVLLLQGNLEEAKAIAKRFPMINLIQCLSETDEPSSQPDAKVGSTMIASIGHKGKYVAVVGVYLGNAGQKSPALNYVIIPIGEALDTPPGQIAGNPLHALLEQYTKEVKDRNYLATYPKSQRHPVQLQFPKAEYVGSEACKDCHPEAYRVWEMKHFNPHMKRDESHSQAYADLVSAKQPSLRQFDGECVVCHVVGFEFQGGYRSEKETPKLTNVGCEVCHGPGSLHADGNRKKELMALMNPFRTPANESPAEKNARMLRLNDFCQKCHDVDNDRHWNIDKWAKIAHPEKQPAKQAGK